MTKSITIDSSYFKRNNNAQDPQQGEGVGNESGALGSGQGNNLEDLTLSNNRNDIFSPQTLESILDYIYQDEEKSKQASDIIGDTYLRDNLDSVSEQIKRRKRYF